MKRREPVLFSELRRWAITPAPLLDLPPLPAYGYRVVVIHDAPRLDRKTEVLTSTWRRGMEGPDFENFMREHGRLARILFDACQHTIHVAPCFAKRRDSVIAIHGAEPGIVRRNDVLQRTAAVAIPLDQ